MFSISYGESADTNLKTSLTYGFTTQGKLEIPAVSFPVSQIQSSCMEEDNGVSDMHCTKIFSIDNDDEKTKYVSLNCESLKYDGNGRNWQLDLIYRKLKSRINAIEEIKKTFNKFDFEVKDWKQREMLKDLIASEHLSLRRCSEKLKFIGCK